MAKPKRAIWPREPHTAAKHKLLATYLERWVPIFQHGHGATEHLVFIDGFAGPGVYASGEPGSPVLMLKPHQAAKTMPTSHLHCFFIDEDDDRAAILEDTIASWRGPRRHIEVICGAYEDHFEHVMAKVAALGDAAVFAFLDPFGAVGNDPDLAVRLVMRPRSEALVYLPVERFADLMGTPEIATTLSRLFTDDRWRSLLDLHGRAPRAQALIEMFRQRLAGGPPGRATGCYVETFLIRSARGGDAYCLFFATKHPTAVEAMRDAMWAVDPANGRQFDERRPPQAGLEVWKPGLADALAARFPPGTSFDFEDAWAFVVDEQPPFGKPQLRKALTHLREQGRLEAVDRTGKAHKRGFPPKTTICRMLP